MPTAAPDGSVKSRPPVGRQSNRIKRRKVRKDIVVGAKTAPQLAREQAPTNTFLRSWVWKREAKSDKERFEIPYVHEVNVDGRIHTLRIHQARFREEGFASTVWDSSIVLAKYFEKHPDLVQGKRCLELGAGCGLVGMVMGVLGATAVTLTDMKGNLPLLMKNKEAVEEELGMKISVEELMWGSDVEKFTPPLDVVVATDVVYNHDVVEPLLKSIRALSGPDTRVYFAYGRNRCAEESFFTGVHKHFTSGAVLTSDLDSVYHCDDVDIYVLHLC